MADGSTLLDCPCNQKANGIRANSVTITCAKCNVKWHAKCVGLNEMTSKESARYNEWVCACCFSMPTSCDRRSDSMALQDQIKTEVLRALPAVVTAVVKQTEQMAVRTYASVTKEAQEQFVKECIEKSSSIAVEKGYQRIEDDIVCKIVEKEI